MAETATVPVAGTWYRHVPAGAAPMPGRPAPDGRWQRGEHVAGLYLAQDRDTVWAEWYRALAELGEPPDSRLPRDLWRFRVQLDGSFLGEGAKSPGAAGVWPFRAGGLLSTCRG